MSPRQSKLKDGDRVIAWRGDHAGDVGTLSEVDGYYGILTYVNNDGTRPGGNRWVELHNCKRYDGPVPCVSCGRLPDEQAQVEGPCQVGLAAKCERRTGEPFHCRVRPVLGVYAAGQHVIDGSYLAECVELPECRGRGSWEGQAVSDLAKNIWLFLQAAGRSPSLLTWPGIVDVTGRHEVAFDLASLRIREAPERVPVVKFFGGEQVGSAIRLNSSLSWATYWCYPAIDGYEPRVRAGRDETGWTFAAIELIDEDRLDEPKVLTL